jgi:hypothetical protein
LDVWLRVVQSLSPSHKEPLHYLLPQGFLS